MPSCCAWARSTPTSALAAGLYLCPHRCRRVLVLRRVLDQNHAPGRQDLFADLGPANVLTIYRGLAYAWMAGFLLLPRPGGLLDWLPALLYIGASIADVFDGYLARRSDRVTRLGETLDMEFDGFGVLVASALAVQYGQLPLVFLLVALARPLFVWGMMWRTRQGLPNHQMTDSDQRRIIAGLLMIFLSTVLWPIFEPPVTYAVGAVFGGAIALSFLRDWLVTIGWLRPAHPAYIHWRARLKLWAFVWAPVLLRIAVALLVALVVSTLLASGTALPASLSWPVAAVAAAAGLTALFGIGARTSAGFRQRRRLSLLHLWRPALDRSDIARTRFSPARPRQRLFHPLVSRRALVARRRSRLLSVAGRLKHLHFLLMRAATPPHRTGEQPFLSPQDEPDFLPISPVLAHKPAL